MQLTSTSVTHWQWQQQCTEDSKLKEASTHKSAKTHVTSANNAAAVMAKVKIKKVKASHTCYQVLGLEMIPV